MVGVLPDATWDESIKDHLANYYAGIFLRRSNLRSVDRARRAIHELRRALGRGLPPLIGIDEEGGFVTNIGHLTTPAPTAAALGAADDADLTQDVYHGIGDKLRAIGVNVVFAPVLDVNSEPANPVIGTRAFGSTPETVITHGLAALRGLQVSGITPCVKHFPGNGATKLDSHVARPEVKADIGTLKTRDLAPFIEAFKQEKPPAMVMTAHVAYPALDKQTPATLSKAILQDLLRKELGFQGVVISDAMEMKAIADRMAPGKAAVQALDAGVDMLLYPLDPAMAATAYAAVLDAVRSKKLNEERIRGSAERVHSLRRALRAQEWLRNDAAEDLLEYEHEQTFFSASQRAITLDGNAGVLADIMAAPGRKLVVLPRELDEHHRIMIEVVKEQLEPVGFTVVDVSPRVGAEELAQVEAQAAEASAIVFATVSRGPMNEESRKFVTALSRRDVMKVGVALLDPGDTDQMMGANCRIKTYGFAVPQLWALCQVLVG
jgi:beta-N-acetylhexosaminidase